MRSLNWSCREACYIMDFKVGIYIAGVVSKYTDWAILQIANAKSRCEP
jgi:hypothetical protein